MQNISSTRVLNSVLSGESPDAVVMRTAVYFPPVGIIETRPAYTRESRERNLHGRFLPP